MDMFWYYTLFLSLSFFLSYMYLQLKGKLLLTKVHLVKADFSSSHVWMWELDYKESWVPKNWCFWTVVLNKALLWVSCVSILSAIYACWVDLDYLLYSSWAVQVMSGFWKVKTTFIKTFSSLFSQLIFFLRLFSSPDLGDCTSWSVLQGTNLGDVQRLFYFVVRSLCSLGESACIELHAQRQSCPNLNLPSCVVSPCFLFLTRKVGIKIFTTS